MVFSPNMQIGCLDWFRVKPSIMPENRISAILFYRIDANRRRFFLWMNRWLLLTMLTN
jgi:hypothetical protein